MPCPICGFSNSTYTGVRFPISQRRAEKYHKALGIPPWVDIGHCYICFEHFDDDDLICSNNGLILGVRKEAVPNPKKARPEWAQKREVLQDWRIRQCIDCPFCGLMLGGNDRHGDFQTHLEAEHGLRADLRNLRRLSIELRKKRERMKFYKEEETKVAICCSSAFKERKVPKPFEGLETMIASHSRDLDSVNNLALTRDFICCAICKETVSQQNLPVHMYGAHNFLVVNIQKCLESNKPAPTPEEGEQYLSNGKTSLNRIGNCVEESIPSTLANDSFFKNIERPGIVQHSAPSTIHKTLQLLLRSVNTESPKEDAFGSEQLDHTLAMAIAIAQESDDDQMQRQKNVSPTTLQLPSSNLMDSSTSNMAQNQSNASSLLGSGPIKRKRVNPAILAFSKMQFTRNSGSKTCQMNGQIQRFHQDFDKRSDNNSLIASKETLDGISQNAQQMHLTPKLDSLGRIFCQLCEQGMLPRYFRLHLQNAHSLSALQDSKWCIQAYSIKQWQPMSIESNDTMKTDPMEAEESAHQNNCFLADHDYAAQQQQQEASAAAFNLAIIKEEPLA